MIAAAKTPLHVALLAAFTVALCVALLVLTSNPVVAMVPVVLALAIQGIVRAPLRITTFVFIFFSLLIEDVRAMPHMGLWQSPLYGIGRFYYDALDKELGVPGLKVYGIEVFLLLIGMLLGLSLFWRKRQVQRPASPLLYAALGAVATVLLLEAWGLSRGGDVRFSMLQMRPMLFTALCVLVCSFVLRTAQDAKIVLILIVVVGVIRAVVGLYFYRFVLPDMQAASFALGSGTFITTHADTVLWVTGLHICLIALVFRPSIASFALNLSVSPLLATAIILNNRRLAIVSLVWGLGILYFFIKPEVRKWANRAVLVLIPLGIAYIVVGWNAQGGWASPVRSVKSIILAEDSSVSMRTIENYNLVVTTKHHPILGQGFGHEYEEVSVGISISDALEAYRYLPHNSLLWLMSAGGVVFFTGYWMLLALGVYVALRVYRHSERLVDDVASLATVLTVNTFAVQCMGDCGMYSWLSIMVLAPLLGLMGGRAAQMKAWP